MQYEEFLATVAEVDETYASLPKDLLLEVERLVNKMSRDFGPRRLRRAGIGTEKYDRRLYRPGDSLKDVDWKVSAKRDGDILVNIKRAENRQPIFFWRKGEDTVLIPPEKKRHMDIALMTAARLAAAGGDQIGVLNAQGQLYRGKNGYGRFNAEFLNVNLITGNTPLIQRKIPRNSTVIIASDFFPRPGQDKQKDINEMHEVMQVFRRLGVQGKLCMVLHPYEINLPYKGARNFKGAGGLSMKFDDAGYIAQAFHKKMLEHIARIKRMARDNGFEFYLHSTEHEPLDLVLNMFGVRTGAFKHIPGLKGIDQG